MIAAKRFSALPSACDPNIAENAERSLLQRT
jgi:hypothetical protein